MIISNFPTSAGGNLPSFTYTGRYKAYLDETGWKLTLLTSGTLTLNQPASVDLFAVGGGGRGADATAEREGSSIYVTVKTGAGGAGGYTATQRKKALTAGVYSVQVGNGGYKEDSTVYEAEPTTMTKGEDVVIYAGAGENASAYTGGKGGSGGGSGYYYNNAGSRISDRGDGGQDGGNGSGTKGGTGQGTTTTEFEENETGYAAGGNGGRMATDGNGADADSNTGNGGGGGNYGGYNTSDAVLYAYSGGTGGSGILIIRSVQEE